MRNLSCFSVKNLVVKRVRVRYENKKEQSVYPVLLVYIISVFLQTPSIVFNLHLYLYSMIKTTNCQENNREKNFSSVRSFYRNRNLRGRFNNILLFFPDRVKWSSGVSGFSKKLPEQKYCLKNMSLNYGKN